MTSYHLHLVSDATGETINSVARACLVQFRGVEPIEHLWSLIRTRRQMEKVLGSIESNPGPVLYTIVNRDLRHQLVEGHVMKEPEFAGGDPAGVIVEGKS